jgi:hypothetical protein
LDGTCEQLLTRLLFPAAANFQKGECAENEDRHSHKAEHRSQPGHRKDVSHWQSTPTGKAHFAFGAQREVNLTPLPLNKFLGISLG